MNIFYKTMISYGYKRLKEASTWRSIIYLIGGTWSITHPNQVEAIIPIIIAISGLVGSFFPDVIGKQNLPEIELVGRSEENNDVDNNSNVNVVPDNKNIVQTNSRPEPKNVRSESKGNTKSENSGFGFNDK